MLLVGLSFLFFLAVHFIWWRSPFKKWKGVKGLFVWGLITALVVSVFAMLKIDLPIWPFVPILILSQLFLVMFYAHWFVGVDRSVSIRILDELSKNSGKMTLEDLDKVYSKNEMFERRLLALKESGWIREENGILNCQPKSAWLVHWTDRLRRIYNIKEAG